MQNEIDLVEFGRFIGAVQALTTSVDKLTVEVDKLSARVDVLEHQISGGKGVVVGLMFASGGLGAGAVELLKHLFK